MNGAGAVWTPAGAAGDGGRGRATTGQEHGAAVGARSELPILLDWPRDEAGHDGLPWEIWWVSAILDAGGRRLAAHLLAIHLRGGALSVSASLTDLDREVALAASHRLLTPGAARVSREALSIEAEEVAFAGSFEAGYRLRAELGDGCGFDLWLAPTMPVLFNGGGGQHLFQGVTTNQYSIGALRATGTVSVAGTAAAAAGGGWYDRQWEVAARDTPLSFTWFGLCLDDGDVLSAFLPGGDDGRGWATIVRRDGTHVVTAVRSAAADVRRSGRGREAPRRWTIELPALDAVLDAGHRTIADDPLIHTGVLDVVGRSGGRPVGGYGFCDIVGPISPPAGAAAPV